MKNSESGLYYDTSVEQIQQNLYKNMAPLRLRNSANKDLAQTD
jgi:hypothetical protein